MIKLYLTIFLEIIWLSNFMFLCLSSFMFFRRETSLFTFSGLSPGYFISIFYWSRNGQWSSQEAFDSPDLLKYFANKNDYQEMVFLWWSEFLVVLAGWRTHQVHNVLILSLRTWWREYSARLAGLSDTFPSYRPAEFDQ